MDTTMTPTTTDRASVDDLERQHAACAVAYDAALDRGDSAGMIAARHRRADLEDMLRVARLLAARDDVATAAAELADAQEAATGHDAAATAALDARDEAYRLFEEAAAALNRIEMDRMFSVNRIEMARREHEGARQRLAQLVNGATGA